MNDKYLLSIDTFKEVMGIESVTEINYTSMFVNIELGVMYYYTSDDDYPYDNNCIGVWELMAKCKEYLMTNRCINIVTDLSIVETIEDCWSAMAIQKGAIAHSYTYLDETEIIAEEQAPTEYEAVFKITDKLIFNK